MELPRSYVTPSCGDSWPHSYSIRSARGSTVLRGSGSATLSQTCRERCRKGYVLHALSRLLGERDRVGRGGSPMGLILRLDRLRTPRFPSRVDYPVAPPAPNINMKKRRTRWPQ